MAPKIITKYKGTKMFHITHERLSWSIKILAVTLIDNVYINFVLF